MEDAFILQPGEGRPIDLGTFRMSVLATSAETGGLFTLLEAEREPAGFGPPMHIHDDCAEAFYVLEGEYHMFIGEHETLCTAGSFVYIPPGMAHGFRVGTMTSRKLNFYAPAGMLGYFDDLSDALSNGTADDEALGEIAERYSMEVLGPVPQGYL